MKLHVMEDFNMGILAVIRDDNNSYLGDAEITSIKTIKNSKRFDFCHVVAKAIIDKKEVVLEGNFYL